MLRLSPGQLGGRKFANCAENMQFVHYTAGQEYSAHYDWDVGKYPPRQRWATLLFNLVDQNGLTNLVGGKTSFPHLGPLDVYAGRGNVALFYNMLEDGNSDVFGLHAALPPTQGDKWIANLWIWEPMH